MAQILASKKIANAIRLANGEALPAEALSPGHMRLYSYYKPSLEAGRYGIEAEQVVEASQYDDGVLKKCPQLRIFNFKGDIPDEISILTQDFEVVAPQFSIDADKINSYYPPNGHTDEGRILPHIVFNDPHFPWLRLAGLADNLKQPVDQGRNQVPWLAVVVFDPSELMVSSTDAIDLGLTTSDGTTTTTVIPSYDPQKLPATGAFPMKVSEYLTSIKSRVYYQVVYTKANDSGSPENQPDWIKLKSSSESTSVIFPTKSRVRELFGDTSDTACATLGRFRFLSHVRHISTIGFPDAGVEEEGYFSICVSATTGDVKTKTAKTMIAHLVSLEHLDSTIHDPIHGLSGSNADRVGLISLHSWIYTVLPAGPSFVDEMQNLAYTAQTLKPPISVLKALSDNANQQQDSKMKTAAQLLYKRLDRGFSITRWRTATGEESIALNRGPLTPSLAPQHPLNPDDPAADPWVGMSMHGKEFQIWDSECGVMNLTYSNAWNLGRLASIGDGPFNSAILRFRSSIWKWASSNTRRFVNNVTSGQDTVNGSHSLMAAIHLVRPTKWQGNVSRINPPVRDEVAPALDHPSVAPLFAQAINNEVDKATTAGEAIYTAFSKDKAASADWVSIFNWVQDALFLAKIPAHYLFQEPSHIKGAPVPNATPGAPAQPPEALRFFHIDDTWMDCFIDGALSVANHLEPDFDRTRVRMKEVFNYYFSDEIANSGMKPIIPRSGFILRSAVVKSTPDLRVTASKGVWDDTKKWIEYQDPETQKPFDPIVRLTRLDEFTIFGLFECALAEVWHIKFAQPPHQQRFAIASGLTLDDNRVVTDLKFQARNLYVRNAPTDDPSWPLFEVQGSLHFMNADTRIIFPDVIASMVNTQAQTANYDDLIPNSAELGLELNDPAYQLDMKGPLAAPTSLAEVPAPYARQFWVKPGEDPFVDIPKPHDPSRSLVGLKNRASFAAKLATPPTLLKLPIKSAVSTTSEKSSSTAVEKENPATSKPASTPPAKTTGRRGSTFSKTTIPAKATSSQQPTASSTAKTLASSPNKSTTSKTSTPSKTATATSFSTKTTTISSKGKAPSRPTGSIAATPKPTTSSSSHPQPKPKVFTHPPITPGPNTHMSRVIPMTAAATTTTTSSTNRGPRLSIAPTIAPNITTPPAQYQAMVCVDYRPAPPMPGQVGSNTCYAPYDYIPVGTKTELLDLMIVIVRISPNSNPNLSLLGIDIELPGTKTTDRDPEPLLKTDPYIGHARMASNLRFVPTLYNNSLVTGAQPILGVRLLVRSGNPDATINVSNDRKTFEATVRLSTCKILPIVKPLGVMVAVDPKQQKFQTRGKCTALLRERYKTGNAVQPVAIRETRFDVMKMVVPGGVDTDANGNAVDI